jgi:hypothetical protein
MGERKMIKRILSKLFAFSLPAALLTCDLFQAESQGQGHAKFIMRARIGH